MGRILCVDYGRVRVGLAVSDPLGSTAQPFDVLERPRRGSLVDAVAAVAADVEATEIVVGLPLRLDGSSGVAAEAVRQFAKALSERVTCGVVLWDERLSTVEASRQMRSAGVGSRKQRGVVDKVAAAVVLRSYLESRGGAAPDPGDVTMPEPVAPAPEERPRSKPRSRARAAAQRTRRDDWRRRLDDG